MSDSEMWADYREERKAKRRSNLESSKTILEADPDITFTMPSPYHFKVSCGDKTADFWPSTGKFKIAGEAKYYRGVRNLIKRLKPAPQEEMK